MSPSKSRRRPPVSPAPTVETTSSPVPESETNPPVQTSAPSRKQQFTRIGDVLRAVREERGEDLNDISDYLRIRANFLWALEESRYEDLPADAYVIGFLRTYANYLNLDGRAAIDQYRKEMAGRRHKPLLSMPQPMSEGQGPSPAMLLVALAAMLLIYIVWYTLSSSDHTTPPTSIVPPLPQAAAVVPPTQPSEALPAVTNGTLPSIVAPTPDAPASSVQSPQQPVPSSDAAAPQTTASPAAPQPAAQEPAAVLPQATPDKTSAAEPETPKIVLRADKESWVSITDSNGTTVIDRILKPGETYDVAYEKGLKLMLGNARGVVINLNGKDLPLFGKNDHVLRNISLDIEKLKKN